MEQEHPSFSLMEQEHTSFSLMEQEHPSFSLMEQEHTSFSLMEQEHPSFSRVLVAQSLVFCVEVLSFCFFSCDHCIVYPSVFTSDDD